VHPLVYVLMAGLVGFFDAVPAALLLGLALGFEALLTLRSGWIPFATHAAFLALFSVIYRIVLNARLALARHAEQEAVKARIKEVEERARTYRLASAGSSEPAADAGSQWMLAAVKQVEGAVGSVLEIGELALRTHTCAAFLLAPDDRTLVLHDCRSSSERVQRGPVNAGEGILAGVLKRSVPVRMVSPSGLRGVTWYDGGPAPRSVCAVPLVEAGGLLRGVLLADRMEPEPFEDRDEALLRTLAGEVLRAIEVERVLVEIRRARDEKGRFFKAIQDLNRAANLEAVFGAVLDGARQLAGLDFAAVTLVSEHEGKREHRVARISGASPAGKTLEGRVFVDNNGLVANGVRYGTPLPGRELRAMDRQVVFDDHTRLRGVGALKILPLAAGDRILGTLVAGARRRASLDEDALRMLEVIALQAGQAVLRAQLFDQTERLATTDGLTGLLNHRAFQARADEALAQARRYGRACSVLLTDVDHFKAVNDTHGHPIGTRCSGAWRRSSGRRRATRTWWPLRRRGVRGHHAGDGREGRPGHRRAHPRGRPGQGVPDRARPASDLHLRGHHGGAGQRDGQAGAHRSGRPVPLLRQAERPEPLGASSADGVVAAVGVSRRAGWRLCIRWPWP
jgi:GAF domain-containing protein